MQFYVTVIGILPLIAIFVFSHFARNFQNISVRNFKFHTSVCVLCVYVHGISSHNHKYFTFVSHICSFTSMFVTVMPLLDEVFV